MAALFACFQISESDVCWHLRTGEWILSHGEVPRVDPFSHTVPGKPWIAFEWLAEAVFYVLTACGGLDALIAFKVCATAAAFLLAALATRRLGAAPEASAAVLLLAALAAHERFFSRPDLFTNLGTAWTVLAYEALGRGRRWPLLLVPPVQALWANLHGGFVMGPLIGLAFAAGAWLNRALSPSGPTASPLRALGLAALGALACLVNPYGKALALYPLTEIPLGISGPGRSIFLETIAEWRSPFATLEFGHPVTLAFYAWAALWGILILLRPGRVDFRGVCLALGTFALAASGRRHIAVHVLATAPFLARELSAACGEGRGRSLAAAAAYGIGVLWALGRSGHPLPAEATMLLPAAALAGGWVIRRIPSAAQALSRTAVLGLFLLSGAWALWLASDRFNEVYGTGRRFGFGATAAAYPEGAIRFLERHRLRGRMFNNLAAGGYLAWRAPEHPVFIDGRNLLYGEAFYADYNRALASDAAWRALADRWGIRLVLLTFGEALGDFPERMERDPGWRLVYSDPLSRLYVRRCADTEAMLARLPPGISTCPTPPPVGPPGGMLSRAARSLRELLAPPGAPGGEDALARARWLRSFGDAAGALRTCREVLHRDPLSLRAHVEAGIAWEALGDLDAAEASFRSALALPGVREAERTLHVLLGTILLRQGRDAEAAGEYAWAEPTDPAPPNNLGVRAMAQGRTAEAVSHFEHALVLDPGNPDLEENLKAAREALAQRKGGSRP